MNQHGERKRQEHTQPAVMHELLRTKLTPPRVHTPLVRRDRLFARLDAGLDYKLTLVSAPAGFGKTTLVSSWLAARRERPDFPSVAWVSLDDGDNDLVRFWRYVITACQTFDPEVGTSALPLLRTPQPPPVEAMLTGFINELADRPDKDVLVLEDYHLITAPGIHETVTFLLDHLPATLHLIIVTRSDPPLPLARLRARHELNELQRGDLRFSDAEVQTFLTQALSHQPTPELVASLAERTEGWAAGLRLVALALERHTEPKAVERYLATFGGSHRSILTYLIEDVFNAQPEPLQRFLLETSTLSRLNGPLCDAITERNDSALLLEHLERANLFLEPLDDTHHWYRYHTLFAEAMQHYAQRRLGDDRLRDISHIASRWYEQQGLLAEAVEAALVAQDARRAADLIARLVAPRVVQNEYYTYKRWIEQLPEDVLQTHPRLCITYAAALLFTADRRQPAPFDRVESLLQMAEQYWQREEREEQLGEVLAFRSLIAWRQGDAARSFGAARQALDLLPADEVQWRSTALVFAGIAALYAGRLRTARDHLTRAHELNKEAANIYGTLSALIRLGDVCARQGDLRQAAQCWQQALAALDEAPMDREDATFRRGQALIGLATLALEWNDLTAAERDISRALAIHEEFPEDDTLQRAPIVEARMLQARGDVDAGQGTLRALIARTENPVLRREAEAHRAWLALTAGDLSTAQRWYDRYDGFDDTVPRLLQEREALVAARVLITQGEAEAALRRLEDWQAEAHAEGRFRTTVEIAVLNALAYAALENTSEARASLVQALTLAQPQGYQRLFLDEGEPLAAVLQDALSTIAEAPLVGYVRALLLRMTQERTDRSPSGASVPKVLIEPLTEREQTVLRLLAAGLSNPEIAEELIISVNTVKTHVKNIYGKLQVNNRADAGDVARELDLL